MTRTVSAGRTNAVRPDALALLFVLACACTDGRRDGESIRDEPVASSELTPEPEPEPEPEPFCERTDCATLPSMNAMGHLGDVEVRFGLDYGPIGVSRQELLAGTRWQVPLDATDGLVASLTITKAELATPESIDEARPRLERLERLELEGYGSFATEDGLLFVRTDPRRASLAIDYFTTLGELAVLCTVRLTGDSPIPEFPNHLERLSHACTSLHLGPTSVGELGKTGLSRQQ